MDFKDTERVKVTKIYVLTPTALDISMEILDFLDIENLLGIVWPSVIEPRSYITAAGIDCKLLIRWNDFSLLRLTLNVSPRFTVNVFLSLFCAHNTKLVLFPNSVSYLKQTMAKRVSYETIHI